jgi:hypothetical protein
MIIIRVKKQKKPSQNYENCLPVPRLREFQGLESTSFHFVLESETGLRQAQSDSTDSKTKVLRRLLLVTC